MPFSALLILLNVVPIMAADVVEFEVCKKSNPDAPPEFTIGELDFTGFVWIHSGAVASINEVMSGKCSVVVMGGGVRYLVKGNAREVTCRLFGDGNCNEVLK